ncbi:hypothetical protein TNIN_318881 [Trichonephila inaurata madagascariensis]|uniref:Uncharacterized protein n=1 Tax=Trichonephila inaurata madagascariensis TaxID=2747483 RepID=A0A8X6YY11_9ARAC|nr:hypothetical protein TNIN_318881 [Trichonephila inaurata madagascariensis]
MLPLERRFYSWEQKNIWRCQVGAVKGLRQRFHIVLSKILHFEERCVARCVVMVQPPIVSNGWADTNNALSQSPTHPTITVQ